MNIKSILGIVVMATFLSIPETTKFGVYFLKLVLQRKDLNVILGLSNELFNFKSSFKNC